MRKLARFIRFYTDETVTAQEIGLTDGDNTLTVTEEVSGVELPAEYIGEPEYEA